MDITQDLYSVTVVVEDQDRALAFYRDVLGCQVRTDVEVWPGGRLVEVVPPGATVAVALLTEAGGLPLGVRYRTADAAAAHRALRDAGVEPHTDVLHLDGAPPMFTFSDPDGATVILMEDQPGPLDAPSTVLAAVPVSDVDRAADFYTRLFGRDADARPMPGLVEWHGPAGVFQAVLDEDRAGGGLVSLQYDDLAAATAAIAARGITVEATAGAVVSSFARLEDPDGNALTLVEN